MGTENIKRRLAAILAADVAGYSRLMSVDDSGTVAALELGRSVFRQSIETNQGRVIDMAGDSVLAVFETAAGAITAAIEIQRQLHEASQEVPEAQRMLFRIGIHAGDVIEKSNGTVYGDGVNVAARLEALSQPGGIAVSDMVYSAVRDRVSVRFEDAGEHQVKNIVRPVRVFQVLLTGAAAANVSIKSRSRRPKRTWIIGAVVSASFGLSAIIWLQSLKTDVEPADPTKMAFSLPDKPSIAVLAFDNMSDDKTQEYFSDGMTEDIITDLSKISGMFVVARNSSFSYKGKSVKIRQVAEELGVRYVLEGSVRRADGKLRINAQLIDAITGGHVWAERYDGNDTDVFSLQDRITGAIVRQLQVTLLPSEQRALADNNTNVPGAHDAFLVGWKHMQTGSLAAFSKAKMSFERAVALDPSYARAWGALAELYNAASGRGYVDSLNFDRHGADALLRNSLARPTVQAYRAHLLQLYVTNSFAEMPAVLVKMEKLEPSYPKTFVWRGILAALRGDTVASLSNLRAAMRLDPASSEAFGRIGRVYLQMEHYPEAVIHLEKAISIAPDDPFFVADLAAAYALAGNADDARITATRLLTLRKGLGHPLTVVGRFAIEDYYNNDYRKNIRKGLRLAGIPQKAKREDINVRTHDQLSTRQLRKLLANGVRLIGEIPEGQWMQDLLIDETQILYWMGREVARGVWRIEEGRVKSRFSPPSTREPYSCDFYRNSKGTILAMDSNLAACTHGVFPFAVFPIPAGPN